MFSFSVIYAIMDLSKECEFDNFIDFIGDLFAILLLTGMLVVTIPLDICLIPVYLFAAVIYFSLWRKRKDR